MSCEEEFNFHFMRMLNLGLGHYTLVETEKDIASDEEFPHLCTYVVGLYCISKFSYIFYVVDILAMHTHSACTMPLHTRVTFKNIKKKTNSYHFLFIFNEQYSKKGY